MRRRSSVVPVKPLVQELLRETKPVHSRVKFCIEETGNGTWRWVLKNRGTAIAISARTWDSKKKAVRAAQSVARHSMDALVDNE